MKQPTGNHKPLPPVAMAWLMLSTALAIAPHWSSLPVWFWPVAAVVYLWRFRYLDKPLPRWQIALVTMAVLVAIIQSARHGLGREAGMTILASMAVLKVLEVRSRRDAWVLITLGFFLVMTRFFYNQDLVLLPWLVGTVLAITYTLLLVQQPTDRPGCQTESAWLNREILRQTIRYLLLSVPMALVLFVFFPRLSSPIWGSPDMFGQGRTGLGDSMSPGSIAQLFLDDSPAMRVNFQQQRPASARLYWRGPVLEQFDGQTWKTTEYILPRKPPAAVPGTPIVSYEVELEPHGQHFLPVLDFVTQVPAGAQLMPDWHVQRPKPVNQLVHYRAAAQVINPRPDNLPQRLIWRLTQLPAGTNPKTRQLINHWRQETPDTRALILRILQWFNQENFLYTFTPPPLQGNTVDQFLFETRAGFCEHYASAFTVMMRAAGVPARVVTGYQGGLDNGDYWLVRQSDAHAWSEVWLPDAGWLRVDPTAAVAPSRVRAGSQNWLDGSRHWYDYGWLQGLRLSLDSWRYRWNHWVRDYNHRNQHNLLQSLGVDNPGAATIAWLMTAAIVLGSLSAWFGLKASRPRRRLSTVEKVFQQLQDHLRKAGIPRRANEAPADYLRRVGQHWPAAGKQAEWFAQEYERLRYAPGLQHLPANDKAVQALQQTARQLITITKKTAGLPVEANPAGNRY